MLRILKRHVREIEAFIGRARYRRIEPEPVLSDRPGSFWIERYEYGAWRRRALAHNPDLWAHRGKGDDTRRAIIEAICGPDALPDADQKKCLDAFSKAEEHAKQRAFARRASSQDSNRKDQ